MKKALPILVCLFFTQWTFAQTPFICTGDFYLTLSTGGPNIFFVVEIDEAGDVNFNQLPNESGAFLNGIGFRSTDRFIYAMDPDVYIMYRIDATGVAEAVATLDLPNTHGYYGADITPDGDFLVLAGTSYSSGNTNIIAQVDLNDPDFAVTSNELSFTGSDNYQTTDIAFDPITGILYAFDARGNRLSTIDLDQSEVDNTTFPTTAVADNMGALFFDPFGNLFGYGNPFSTNISTEFYSFNKNTGSLSLRAMGPPANNKDGCACPYTIKLQKTVEPEETIPCSEVTYTFEITNQSSAPRAGIDFEDVMPEDFTIIEIIENPFGGVVSGIGTNVLSISDMNIPLGIDSILVRVEIGEGAEGLYRNQATLDNLPDFLGSFTVSDNPKTLQSSDSTDLFVLPLSDILVNNENAFCEGESLVLSALEYDGLTYTWNTGSTNPSIEVLEAGQYSVTVESNCGIITDSIFVESQALTLDLDPDLEINLGDEVQLNPTITLNNGTLAYDWIDSLGTLSCLDCAMPTALPFENVTYTLNLSSNGGCMVSDDIHIAVQMNRDIYVATAFSPDDDGRNDLFYLQGSGVVHIQTFRIFDRWGEMVFEATDGTLNDKGHAWNGEFKDKKMNPAVFVWVAEVEYLDGVETLLSGEVVLVR